MISLLFLPNDTLDPGTNVTSVVPAPGPVPVNRIVLLLPAPSTAEIS